MINLISKQYRQQLAAAQRNVILRKYLVILGIIEIIVAVVFIGSIVMLSQSADAYRADTERYKPQLKEYENTVSLAAKYNKNLTTASSLFQEEIRFSNVIGAINSVLPTEVRLSNLQLTTAALSKPIELTFTAKNNGDALQLKNNFARSSTFKDVYIKSTQASGNTDYPIQVMIVTTLDLDSLRKGVY